MPFEMNCVNCGSTLKITEWGPNRICPSCGKNTVNVDIKEVHVNFSDTTYGDPAALPRESSNRFIVGVDYLNVCFRMELSVGDISSPPRSNAFTYAHRYGSAQSMDTYVENQLNKLAQANDKVIVYLWINERDVNAYLNLLKFSGLFKRFEEVYLIRCCSEEDMQNDAYEPNDSFANRIRLTNEELDAMTAEYSKIVSLGGEYRVGCYGDVHICSEEYLQGFVMKELTNQFLGFNSIYCKVQEAFKAATDYIIHYNMVEEIVSRLIAQGRIESHGACMWWGESCYNNMLCTQSFRISEYQHQAFTYDDVLEVVCDAFEFGYTYPLYDLLDDESTLTNGETTAVGKWDVIEFIENDGSYRVHSCKEKVSCNITKVEEGKDYQKDDIYILLNYEKEESNEYWLVKVVFDGNAIRSLDISKPKGGLKLVSIEE